MMNLLVKSIRNFVSDRDWSQFHSPKNLSMALTKECAELMEIFQWKTIDESESGKLSDVDMFRIKEEIGDIVIYLTMICDRLEIDPIQEGIKKVAENARKYPVSKSIGNSLKYTELKSTKTLK